MKPADTHCTWAWPTWKYRLSAGTATLTIVAARIDAIVPIITVNSTSHL